LSIKSPIAAFVSSPEARSLFASSRLNATFLRRCRIRGISGWIALSL